MAGRRTCRRASLGRELVNCCTLRSQDAADASRAGRFPDLLNFEAFAASLPILWIVGGSRL